MASEESFTLPSYVVMAYDATKDCSELEFSFAVNNIRKRGDIFRRGNTLVVLGVLHLVSHPLGYRAKACQGLFQISTHAVRAEISKKADTFLENLQKSAETCADEGVSIEVKITAGSPTKQVILQEIMACNATWLILDRRLERDLRFYINKIPCRIAFIRDIFSVEVIKSFYRSGSTSTRTNVKQHKSICSICSICKPVPVRKSQASDREVNDDGEDDDELFSCESYPFSIESQEDPDAPSTSFKPSSSHVDTPYYKKEQAHLVDGQQDDLSLEVIQWPDSSYSIPFTWL